MNVLSKYYLSASQSIDNCISNAKKLKANTDGAFAALDNKIEGLTEDLANYQNISRTVRSGENMDGLDVASLRVDLDNIKRIDAKSKHFSVKLCCYLHAYLFLFYRLPQLQGLC